ncbi:hypothetical protein OUZ56_013063 [Daphnia magna]|uniref:Peptidase M14 domain-containing protein n=1 Tax=Daphnia magna TaxID=35525 RepID=A0ABQ9Z4S7_9CRUS|nr:hypothetical protein OUZ56_013063 [Daphnia magna]
MKALTTAHFPRFCSQRLMMSLLFAIALGCVFITSLIVAKESELVSYSGFQVWKIKPSSEEDRQFVSEMIDFYKLQMWNERQIPDEPIDVLVPPQSRKKLNSKLADRKIPYVVAHGDLQTVIDNQNTNTNKNTSDTKAAYNMDWTSYHRLSNIYAFLTYLNTTYPRLVQLINIGFHAREWISPAVTTCIIQQLVEVPANAKLLSNVDWSIMPVVNPDGYEFSHTRDRLWRKTRSMTTNPACRGVDPNRNFGYKWGGMGASTNPCEETYRGTKAFSEPETLATSNFILSKKNQIRLYLTLHSFGQVALIPYGYDVVYAPDHNDLLALANDATSKFVEYTYEIGGSDDWAKSIGIKYSYTFELPAKGTYDFLLPASDILPVCEDFFPAFDVFAAKVATCCGPATTTIKPRTTPTTRKTTASTRKTTTTRRQPTTATSKRTTTKCPCVCG